MRKVWTLASRIGVPMVGALLAIAAVPVGAQVRTIDPNQAIDSDLTPRARAAAPRAAPSAPSSSADFQRYPDEPAPASIPVDRGRPAPAGADYRAPAGADYRAPARAGYRAPVDPAAATARDSADAESATGQTFKRQDLLRAAEGTFGKGAAGLAGILERTLKEQGEPNAYIAGREAAGAIVLGLRYGKGTMFHKVEGEKPVYWTGPSLGFDLGGDATKVFVLVYNLYDSEDLYRRFPAAEGRLYFVGGFAATYLRRGNTVLIPIRLGIGWRQGVNIGYMKFSHKSRWLPF